jgi:hypothetical protein
MLNDAAHARAPHERFPALDIVLHLFPKGGSLSAFWAAGREASFGDLPDNLGIHEENIQTSIFELIGNEVGLFDGGATPDLCDVALCKPAKSLCADTAELSDGLNLTIIKILASFEALIHVDVEICECLSQVHERSRIRSESFGRYSAIASPD